MGQKVHPNGMRLGIIRAWDSNWFAEKGSFRKSLERDSKIRTFLKQHLGKQGAISKIRIEQHKGLKVSIFTARPGVVIGKKGEDIERLRQALTELTKEQLQVSIHEIRKPELDATLAAESIANQLERRVVFRRAMRRATQNAMRLGAQGIKVEISGRLNGAEIARREWHREGRVPLHTFRADIDYGVAEAKTTYGIIGVKVWIFKGEILTGMPNATLEPQSTVPSKSPAHLSPSKKPARGGRVRHQRERESQHVAT